jgi:hypothetical protein
VQVFRSILAALVGYRLDIVLGPGARQKLGKNSFEKTGCCRYAGSQLVLKTEKNRILACRQGRVRYNRRWRYLSLTKVIKSRRDTQMAEEEIGRVSDFFARPVVAGIELTGPLKVGDRIRIKGHTTDLELTVESMQIDNAAVQEAKAGDSIGIKVPERVRGHDTVYKIVD